MSAYSLLEELQNEVNSQLTHGRMEISDNHVRIVLSEISGIFLEIGLAEGNSKPSYFFRVQANRFFFDGDKTDLNDILALLLSVFLRLYVYDASCVIKNISDNFAGIDTEINRSYLLIAQSHPSFIFDKNSPEGIKFLRSLIYNLALLEASFWDLVGCPCPECQATSGLDPSFTYNLPKSILDDIKRVLTMSSEVSDLSRKLPAWDYYRDFKKRITLIRCEGLVTLLRQLYESNTGGIKSLDGVGGAFFVSDYIKNCVPKAKLSKGNKILNGLEKIVPQSVVVIPIENAVIFIGEKYILVQDCDSGFNNYRREKEILRVRHKQESRILFPPSTFKWANSVNADRFEGLIKELLEREPNINWVRKSGATKERDGGRDLIAEKVCERINSLTKTAETFLVTMVVQCKALSKAVGKSAVVDIRDTIEYHNSAGYFIAVSTHITSSLMAHLLSLKQKNNYIIDWWTRDEIEARLKENEDILLRYTDLVVGEHHGY